MKNKYQLIFLNILITFLSLYFTYVVYAEYQQSQTIKTNNYINSSIQRNKKIIKNIFITIQEEIKKDKKLFKEIHTFYTKLLRKNPNYPLADLKKDIYKKYNLKDKEIHLFLLNNQYVVTHSTYSPDIGFDLSQVLDAKIELQRSHDLKIHQSETISIDIINSEIKSYSYSKINNNLYFEMGLINKRIYKILKVAMTNVQLLTNPQSNLYRIEQRLDGSEYYDDIINKDVNRTKEEYLQHKKKYFKNKPTNNKIILANRTGKIQTKHSTNHSLYYIPLIKKNNDYLKIMGDFVLELYIDKNYQQQLSYKIANYFYLFFIFHIFFLINIYYFTLKYYQTQKKLHIKLKDNHTLLEENKSFIFGISKQIKAPLSVIMNNFSFIEKYIDKTLYHYSQQINSAINMLRSSYNDLTYISNNKSIMKYPQKQLDLSEFLNKSIDFFDTIAIANNKIILRDIQDNICLKFNDNELERFVDNNLSNAIKYGNKSKKIVVSLHSTQSNISLKFHSFAEAIQNKEKIFERNFQEKSHTKGLGLGLSMVKSLCIKYNIEYKVYYKDGANVFAYKFKK